MSEILTAISTVGFPIVCCLGMFYYWNKETQNHREEMLALKDAIANNTTVVQQLVDRLSKDSDS